MASLTEKAGFLVIANFIKYAVGFVMPMVLVRLLSQEDYGSYQQMLLVNSIALGLMTFGLPNSIYYFFHRQPAEQRKTFVAQTAAMLGACGVVTTLIIFFVAPLIAGRMNNPDIEYLMRIYAVAVGLMLAGEHFVHVMVAQDQYRTAVLFEVGESIVRVGVLILPLLFGLGLQGLIVALVVYALARLAFRTHWMLTRMDGSWQGWNAAVAKEQWAYSLPMAMTWVVALTGGYLDRAIVAVKFTPVDYAIYTVGALEIPLDSIFQASVANVLRASFPQLVAQGQLEEMARLLRESVRKLAIIVIPSFVFLFGHAQLFITTLFTQQYADSVHVFRIYLCLIPLHMFVLSMIPQVFGRTRLNFNVSVFAVTSHVILSFVLLYTVGFFGPAISAVVSAWLSSAVYFYVGMRLLKTSPAGMLPLGALVRTTLAALAGLGAAWLVKGVFSIGLVQLAFSGLVFSVVFLVCGALIGVFTQQDRALAQKLLGRVLGPRFAPKG